MTGTTGRIEMALAPDRSADPLSWDWTPVTSSAKVETLAINRGQTSGGADEMQPGSMSFPLLNPGGVFTPGRADSPHYPNLVQGTPVRAVVTGQRDPYLAITGESASRATTPDNAALDIVGDLALAMEFECPLRVPPSGLFAELAAKWVESGNQLSWRFITNTTGGLFFQWTTNGLIATQQSRDLTLGLPRADAGVLTVGFYLDVDNGASGNTMHWYVAPNKTIDDLVASPATYEVQTTTNAGTTSIFSSSAALEIGDNSGSGVLPPIGMKVRRLILRSGTMSAGTIAANPIFTAEDPGDTSFTDSAGRVWTVNAPASITDDQVRMIGELASNSPRWPALSKDAVAETEWQVMGPLSRMRQGDKPLQSCLYRTITAPNNADNVVAYWPLEDGTQASTGFSPIAGVKNLSIGGGTGWRFASDSTLISSNPLPHVDGTIAFSALVPPYSATQSRIDLFFRINTPNVSPATTTITAIDVGGGTVARWVFTINDTSFAIGGLNSTGGSVVSTSFASDPAFFNTWVLFSFDIAQNAGNVDWEIDLVPIPGGISFGTSGSFAGTVGTVAALHNWNTLAPTSGGISLGHMIVSTGVGLGWLAPADTAFVGEPAAARFYRLCLEQGVMPIVDGAYAHPAFWAAAMTAGAKAMGPQRPAPLLELLTECAVTENARIGESKEVLNALTYRANYENQTPRLTVAAELGNPFEPTGDTQGRVNDITVKMPQATSHRQVDQASIDASGLYDSTREVNTATALQLPNLASWALHESLWPGLRVPVLRIELGNNPALFDSWLALRMGDLVRFTGLPPGFPETALDVLVDGYTEELSKTRYGLTLNVRPGGPWEVGVRNDAGLGIRDTGGSVLDAQFVAGTNTTMSVATTLGPLWAVTAASNTALPFDVNVGGARITVTAIGAASGQVQTFTVTQTPVNGIIKTVPAGTPVRVWRPARRAF